MKLLKNISNSFPAIQDQKIRENDVFDSLNGMALQLKFRLLLRLAAVARITSTFNRVVTFLPVHSWQTTRLFGRFIFV